MSRISSINQLISLLYKNNSFSLLDIDFQAEHFNEFNPAMDGNGASAGGVGPGSAGGGAAIAASPGGPNHFAWGAPPLGGGATNDQLRTNSGNNPAAGPPMDIQQILQQQQVNKLKKKIIWHST